MKPKLPDKETKFIASSYGFDQQNEANTMKIEVEGIGSFYFSKREIIAFQIGKGKLRVRHNYGDPDTGKHLDEIDGGHLSTRLTKEAFDEAMDLDLATYAGNPNTGN